MSVFLKNGVELVVGGRGKVTVENNRLQILYVFLLNPKEDITGPLF